MHITQPIKNLLLAAMLAGGLAAPALAQVSININLAPPSPQQEMIPVLAPDRIWAPGYWAWSGDRYIWVRGQAIMRREGYRWAPDHWEQRGDGYHRRPGYWVRDTSYVFVKEKKSKKNKHGHDDDHDDNRDGNKHGKGHGKGHRD